MSPERFSTPILGDSATESDQPPSEERASFLIRQNSQTNEQPANHPEALEGAHANRQVATSFPDRDPLLPRPAWQSKVAFVKTVFRIKKRLDEIEESAISQT